jgi:site-specific DNA recombinase
MAVKRDGHARGNMASGIIHSSGAKRALIYLRVSSQGQVDTDYDPEGISIPAQRAACIKLAKELGALVADEYVEPGRSAKELDKRPVFQEMRRRVLKDKDVDYVIVYMFNRAFRNAADTAVVKREFRKAGARLVASNLFLDDTPESDMIEGILSYVDEYRIKADGKDIAYKMGEKAKKGGTISGAKFGYKNVRIELEDGRKVADVVLDEERSPYVKQMYELYATGRYGYYDIQEMLTERGLKTRAISGPTLNRPAGKISIHSIGRILTDHYYCGWVTYDGIEYKGRHPAIISEQLFERVQRVLHGERGGGTRNRIHKHFLKGRLWCNRCGKRLLLAQANGNGGTYLYFFCIGRNDKTCNLPYLRVDGIIGVEDAVSRHYESERLSEDFCGEAGNLVESALKDEQAGNDRVRRDLSKRLVQLGAKEDALMDLVGEPDWPREKLNARMQAVRRERAGVERQLSDIRTTLDAGREIFTHGVQLLSTPRALYDAGSEVVKGVLTKAIFTKIYLDADEHRRATVTAHELAEPFDALSAAQQAWQRRQADDKAATSDNLSATLTGRKALVHNRGGGSLVEATAPVGRVAGLLASVFEDCGSSKANVVELRGIEPRTYALQRRLTSQDRASCLLRLSPGLSYVYNVPVIDRDSQTA